MEKAIKMAEGNACMRRIVAAPTAGSCGVIPAVFLTAQEKLACTEEQMVAAMYISAGVGAVIAENASIAARLAVVRQKLVLHLRWPQQGYASYRVARMR